MGSLAPVRWGFPLFAPNKILAVMKSQGVQETVFPDIQFSVKWEKHQPKTKTKRKKMNRIC